MFVSGLLTAGHDVGSFGCGQPTLDDWLALHALRAQGQDTARTYVWTEETEPPVLAFYSIAPTQVTAAQVSRGIAGGNSTVPGFLLARLALDRRIQGRGLGGQLLRDALDMIVTASATGAGRVVVVDPIDEKARSFYRHFGFVDTKADDRMVMKIATVREHMRSPSLG